MKRLVKLTVCHMLCLCFFLSSVVCVQAAPELATPSYILIEASTGQIVCEKEAEVRRSPASITKIMTLLLILIIWIPEGFI